MAAVWGNARWQILHSLEFAGTKPLLKCVFFTTFYAIKKKKKSPPSSDGIESLLAQNPLAQSARYVGLIHVSDNFAQIMPKWLSLATHFFMNFINTFIMSPPPNPFAPIWPLTEGNRLRLQCI